MAPKSLNVHARSFEHRAARAFLSLAVGMGATYVFSLSSTRLLTLVLEKKDYGNYVTVFSLQSLLVIFGTLGLQTIVPRELAGQSTKRDTVLGAYLCLAAIASSVIAFAILIVSAYLPAPLGTYLVWLAFANIAGSLSLQPFFDAEFWQGQVAVIACVCEALAFLALGFAYSRGGLSAARAVQILAAKTILVSLVQAAVFAHRHRAFRWHPPAIKKFARNARSLLPLTALTLIPAYSGVLIVRAFGGSSEAAVFGLAQQLHVTFLMAASLAVRVYYPFFVSRFLSNQTFPVSRNAVVGVAAGLALVWGLAAYGLVHFCFDARYQMAVVWLCVLLVGDWLSLASDGLSVVLLTQHRDGELLQAKLISAVVYVLVCGAVGRFSPLGTAASYVLAMAVGLVWIYLRVGATRLTTA